VSPNQEAVMTESKLFRQYAKEAMHCASKVISENEKRNLIDLACTWAQAALMNGRALEPSFVFVAARRR
jgi:hypothetical protein